MEQLHVRELKELLQSNINNLVSIKQIIKEYEQKIDKPLLILEVILEILHTKKIPKDVELFLWEKVAIICEKLFEFERAIGIYHKLYLSTSNSKYLEKIENLKILKVFEKFKDILKNYSLSLNDLLKIYQQSLETNKSIESILIEKFKISKKSILECVENYYKIPAFELRDLAKFQKLPQVLTIKKQFFLETLCIPFKDFQTQIIYLVCYNPEDKDKIEKVKKILQIPLDIKIAYAIKEDIIEAIERYYSQPILTELEIEEVPEEEEIEETALIDSAIVQLVNSIIEEAYKMRASDIHWESLTGKKGLRVRFRVDGECFLHTTIPEHQKRPVISRIKIMANLDIAERRLPQDGKIKFKTKNGKSFEIRVATIPTIENNEDVVMRILGGIEFRTLEEIHLSEENYKNFKKILDYPYGLILVVGPTGSGKTTTLHAALKYLNKPNRKIWTAEDPVEIVQEGLRQVQVNPKIGLTFHRILRAFLRADPDIIMIGETRDHETAHTLVEASLTGHLVLSTLHTNSAPETVTRLLNMGIDPYNFADALLGILAQRLAKKLCPNCKEPYTPSQKEIERIKREYGYHPVKPLSEEEIKNATLFRPVGCHNCNYTGFKGRIAIHELLIPDDEIKTLIVKNTPANKIRNAAIEKGFLTLKQDGILKVLKGETTLQQILAVTVR
ncbi:GspE/PulE family protein [Thermodesulfobacterium hydrogeniphilum]|uniref:GspE/PulE family protein n=1 Tax=Thermodesulfobacterium hydrogeniphilum TaxID=161156 RepID=UPI000571036F|nr:GspE/PulE family protein [Thermodesulfobacterium hydrogeniphilum]